MDNVIKLNRIEEDDNEKLSRQFKELIDSCFERGYTKIALIACPDDMVPDFDAHFATSFQPSMYELMAIEVLSDYMRTMMINVEEN